jgi:hypothetical protein
MGMTSKQPVWCLLHLTGYQQIAGQVSEAQWLSLPMLRVDIPVDEARTFRTEYVAPHAIARVEVTTEADVRAFLRDQEAAADDDEQTYAHDPSMLRDALLVADEYEVDEHEADQVIDLADTLGLTARQRDTLFNEVSELLSEKELAARFAFEAERDQPFLELDEADDPPLSEEDRARGDTPDMVRKRIIIELNGLAFEGVSAGDERFLALLEKGIRYRVFTGVDLIANLVGEIRRLQQHIANQAGDTAADDQEQS